MKRLPPEQVIAEYRAAYVAANGTSSPSITYQGGWFCIRYSPKRYRGAQIIHMTATLNQRAKSKG